LPTLRIAELELDPHRHVIGRLFPAADMLVDAGGGQRVGGRRRQQQMVDADAPVLLPGAGLVVPERVEPRPIGGGADGLGEAEVEEGAEPRPRLRRNSASPVQAAGLEASAGAGMTL